MTRRRITITDTPHRVNIHNYEQRLRKYRTLLLLMASEIDTALDEHSAQKLAEARLIDALTRN